MAIAPAAQAAQEAMMVAEVRLPPYLEKGAASTAADCLRKVRRDDRVVVV